MDVVTTSNGISFRTSILSKRLTKHALDTDGALPALRFARLLRRYQWGSDVARRATVIEREGWIATSIVASAVIAGVVFRGWIVLTLFMLAVTIYFAYMTGQAAGIRLKIEVDEAQKNEGA